MAEAVGEGENAELEGESMRTQATTQPSEDTGDKIEEPVDYTETIDADDVIMQLPVAEISQNEEEDKSMKEADTSDHSAREALDIHRNDVQTELETTEESGHVSSINEGETAKSQSSDEEFVNAFVDREQAATLMEELEERKSLPPAEEAEVVSSKKLSEPFLAEEQVKEESKQSSVASANNKMKKTAVLGADALAFEAADQELEALEDFHHRIRKSINQLSSEDGFETSIGNKHTLLQMTFNPGKLLKEERITVGSESTVEKYIPLTADNVIERPVLSSFDIKHYAVKYPAGILEELKAALNEDDEQFLSAIVAPNGNRGRLADAKRKQKGEGLQRLISLPIFTVSSITGNPSEFTSMHTLKKVVEGYTASEKQPGKKAAGKKSLRRKERAGRERSSLSQDQNNTLLNEFLFEKEVEESFLSKVETFENPGDEDTRGVKALKGSLKKNHRRHVETDGSAAGTTGLSSLNSLNESLPSTARFSRGNYSSLSSSQEKGDSMLPDPSLEEEAMPSTEETDFLKLTERLRRKVNSKAHSMKRKSEPFGTSGGRVKSVSIQGGENTHSRSGRLSDGSGKYPIRASRPGKKVVGELHVKLSKTRIGKIVVYERDNPFDLATSFGKTYSLKPYQVDKIEHQLTNKLFAYYKKKHKKEFHYSYEAEEFDLLSEIEVEDAGREVSKHRSGKAFGEERSEVLFKLEIDVGRSNATNQRQQCDLIVRRGDDPKNLARAFVSENGLSGKKVRKVERLINQALAATMTSHG